MVWGLVERGWLEAVTAVDDFAVVFAGGCGEGSGFSSRRNVIFFEDDAGEMYGCSVTVMFDMLFTYSRCCVLHCTGGALACCSWLYHLPATPLDWAVSVPLVPS